MLPSTLFKFNLFLQSSFPYAELYCLSDNYCPLMLSTISWKCNTAEAADFFQSKLDKTIDTHIFKIFANLKLIYMLTILNHNDFLDFFLQTMSNFSKCVHSVKYL